MLTSGAKITLDSNTPYSNQGWKDMSKADKQKVMNLRMRSLEAKASKAAAASSEEPVDAEDEQPDDAGKKFGWNSHKKRKKAQE